jgi:hypothetical protein
MLTKLTLKLHNRKSRKCFKVSRKKSPLISCRIVELKHSCTKQHQVLSGSSLFLSVLYQYSLPSPILPSQEIETESKHADENGPSISFHYTLHWWRSTVSNLYPSFPPLTSTTLSPLLRTRYYQFPHSVWWKVTIRIRKYFKRNKGYTLCVFCWYVRRVCGNVKHVLVWKGVREVP